MFDFVRNHMRKLQFILTLLILPSMGFLGVQSYKGFSEDATSAPAKVDGQAITQAEWDSAHRDQVEQMRRRMPNVDPKLLDSPELKKDSLENLVQKRVLMAAANQLHLSITDDRLQRLFATSEQFAPIRNADGSVNKELLAAQGMSSEMFAARLRQDLSMQQVAQGLSSTVFASKSVADQAVDTFFQQRQAHLQRFDASAYASKVTPTDADIEQYYKDPAHESQFQAPEQASIEYVVLDVEALKKGVAVNEEDLRRYYDENASRFGTPEERRASHILIAADKSLPAEQRAKARAKAEELSAALARNPAQFAELAKKNSQDPGSAAKGGDLDFFARGAMVKPFEDVAYSLKVGQTSAVVETDFGFHIIRLTDVRGGDKRSFESARPEIETDIRKQLAQEKFAEAAEDFTNMVYEQPDSLKPVIDKYKLELKTAQGVTRKPAPDAKGVIASAKFLDAIFSSDALANKRNTPAVEVAARQLVSGRVLNHEAAHALSLDQVKDKVRLLVTQSQAAALARKAGEQRLAELKQAPQTDMRIEPQLVSRLQTGQLGEPLINAILSADMKSAPGFAGVDLGAQGYVVVRIDKVIGRDPAAADTSRAISQYAQAWGAAESQAYLASLRNRYKVQINEKEVAKKTLSDSTETR
jgi:peptidyl-prolyl cis-trans isomerase D